MPPKLPNLKFKPRHVVRPKEEPDISDSSTALDNLSIVQLERLRRQREAAFEEQQRGSERRQDEGHGATALANPDKGPDITAPHGSGSIARGGRPRGSAASAVAALAHNYSNLPAEAERFGENTMSSILNMESDCPGAVVYHPIPLDGCPHAGARYQNDGMTEEEGRGDVGLPSENDGVAFLKGYSKELENSRKDNLRFERDILRASASTDVDRRDIGDLVWLQLPRFQADAPFKLSNLPPGKVGEIKVYRSGRMVMEISGVSYDMTVEGLSSGGGEACNVVSAVTAAQQPTDMARCYQLGFLSRKLVCMPNINVDAL
ncbi:unnamed protein product [Trypanosoma congolense IL3000]|uniref:WGS project CAEQ00000000 data, annotated contig 663 n=1 Tax=Trypanosoma congolense (strain IL3000) TaxID=1068625 RepID=F9WHK8_TRYCI|nr:unnamed protein product [Trypanosoma congolense IL3000]